MIVKVFDQLKLCKSKYHYGILSFFSLAFFFENDSGE